MTLPSRAPRPSEAVIARLSLSVLHSSFVQWIKTDGSVIGFQDHACVQDSEVHNEHMEQVRCYLLQASIAWQITWIPRIIYTLIHKKEGKGEHIRLKGYKFQSKCMSWKWYLKSYDTNLEWCIFLIKQVERTCGSYTLLTDIHSSRTKSWHSLYLFFFFVSKKLSYVLRNVSNIFHHLPVSVKPPLSIQESLWNCLRN